MGNHLSCISPAALTRLQATSDCRSQNLIKFLHAETGDISELEGPLTAAEVMMEFPAQFLSCVSIALSNGRRISAVPADEELQAQELYLLLPMHKLNTRFSSQEVAFFASLDVAGKEDSGKKSRRGAMNSQSKVAPLPASMSAAKSSNTDQNLVGHSILRSSSFKGLDSMALEGHAASHYMIGTAAAKNVMCRSKSWIPKLETIRESAVVS